MIKKYYADQLETIKIYKDRRKQKQEPVTEKERTKLRGIIGAINWLMTSTRPDIAVHAGFPSTTSYASNNSGFD